MLGFRNLMVLYYDILMRQVSFLQAYGVHMLYLDDQDIEIAAQRKIAVAHCPGSNAKSGRPICPAWQLSKAGVAIGLAQMVRFQETLWIVQNIVALPQVAKVREHKREIVSAQEALYAATIGGAEVLGLSDQIGSIECGKLDLQIVDLNDFNALPVHNWYATAVYSLQAHNVRDTIVAGSF